MTEEERTVQTWLPQKNEEAYRAKIEGILVRIGQPGDDEESLYRRGIAYYLTGDYENCLAQEKASYKKYYQLGDEEMGIAAMFWHTLAAWRLGVPAEIMDTYYRPNMNVGHHYTYDEIMGIAAGHLSLPECVGKLYAVKSGLDFAIIGYGMSEYMRHIGLTAQADNLRRDVVRDNSFWIAYAWLAAWTDQNRAEGKE